MRVLLLLAVLSLAPPLARAQEVPRAVTASPRILDLLAFDAEKIAPFLVTASSVTTANPRWNDPSLRIGDEAAARCSASAWVILSNYRGPHCEASPGGISRFGATGGFVDITAVELSDEGSVEAAVEHIKKEIAPPRTLYRLDRLLVCVTHTVDCPSVLAIFDARLPGAKKVEFPAHYEDK